MVSSPTNPDNIKVADAVAVPSYVLSAPVIA